MAFHRQSIHYCDATSGLKTLHGGDFALANAAMGDPGEIALARIEAALARIEAAAAQMSNGPREGDAGLEARHQQLRDAVTQSLQQLDALIDGHGA